MSMYNEARQRRGNPLRKAKAEPQRNQTQQPCRNEAKIMRFCWFRVIPAAAVMGPDNDTMAQAACSTRWSTTSMVTDHHASTDMKPKQNQPEAKGSSSSLLLRLKVA